VYYARDLNILGAIPLPSTTSDAKRSEFLQLFNTAIASPEETFSNVTYTAPLMNLQFPTIGQMTISGIIGYSLLPPPFDDGLALVLVSPLAIQFSAPVIAFGFYAFDFVADVPYTIQANLNGEPGTTFVIPTTAPSTGASLNANLAYIGMVHLGGFDYLEFSLYPDGVFVDNFAVFKASELL
jgi:hypothetical protein